LNGAFIIL